MTAARAGILVRFRCRVEHCSVTDATGRPASGDGGFTAGIECIFDSCTATSYAAPGFVVSSSTQLRNCLSTTNTGNGFTAGNQCRLVDCTASGNSGLGYLSATGARPQIASPMRTTPAAFTLLESAAFSNVARPRRTPAAPASASIPGPSVTAKSARLWVDLVSGVPAAARSPVIVPAAHGVAGTPQNGFLIEGGRARVEGNHAYNNTGVGFEVTNTSGTNSFS